jgi:hypothetical protein
MQKNLANIVNTLGRWYNNPKLINRDTYFQTLESLDAVDSLVKRIDTMVDDEVLKTVGRSKSSIRIDKEIKNWIKEKLEEEYPVDREGYLGTKVIDKNYNFKMILKEIVREELRYFVSHEIKIQINKHEANIRDRILKEINLATKKNKE